MPEKLRRDEMIRHRGMKRKSNVELGKGVRGWLVQSKFVSKFVELELPFSGLLLLTK